MDYALDFSLCKFIHQNSERYPPPYKQAARFNVGQLLAAAVCIDSILLLFLKKTRELHANASSLFLFNTSLVLKHYALINK